MILDIHKYNINFSIKCDRKGKLIINQLSIKPFLDRYLAEFIELPKENYFDPKPRYKIYYNIFYDKSNNDLYIHNSFLNIFIRYINGIKYRIIEHPPIEYKNKANIRFKKHITDKSETQTHLINWMLNNNYPIICVPLQTGEGKTYCSIKYIIIKNKISLIISPAYLQNNWIVELKKFTNIKDKDIYIIKSRNSINKLLKSKKNKYKIYLSTIQTLSSFIKTSSKKEIDKLFKIIKASVKIIDEVHLNFKQILLLDLVSNFKYNIYLSATFYRTNKKSDLIFQTVFDKRFRYKTPTYKKYVNITEVIYHNLNNIPEKAVYTSKGYNETKYEKYLCKHRNLLNNFVEKTLYPLLENKYINIKNNNEKCLIIIRYKKFGELIKDFLIKNFHFNLDKYKIGCYYYEHTEEHRNKLDIIISTVFSSSTGENIPNLRTVLLIDNFKAKGLLIQTLGRLRKIEYTNSEFVYFENINIKAHRYYRYARIKILKHLADKFKTINIY